MRIFVLSAFVTVSVFGQHRGGAPSAPVHLARPSAPTFRPAAPITRPSVPVNRSFAPRPLIVPYPVFIGGGYYNGYDSGYAAPAPVAVVNPDFRVDGGTPTLVDYYNVPSQVEEAAPATDENGLKDDQPTVFLIALTDHTVLAAIAYWVDGDSLNWVSRDAKQNRVSLSLVDREFSQQLNDQRHVEFKLPPAK